MQKNSVIFSNLYECHESSQMNKMWKVTDDVNEKRLNIFSPNVLLQTRIADCKVDRFSIR